jgi:hypothetical protein
VAPANQFASGRRQAQMIPTGTNFAYHYDDQKIIFTSNFENKLTRSISYFFCQAILNVHMKTS